MHEFHEYREKMVDNQIRPNDVTNHELISAFLSVPRELYVPAEQAQLAYIDEDLHLAADRFLMEPTPFSKLVQACGIKKDDMVLDIGCASGYSTAIISRLASFVVALEQEPSLVALAKEQLEAQEVTNTMIVEGPLNQGFAKEAPFDVILINGAVEHVPIELFDQLNDGGRLCCVLGHGNAAVATLYSKSDNKVSARSLFNCSIKTLPGFSKPAEFAL